MNIKEFFLEKINFKNKNHLSFLKELMTSSNMHYLWDISNEDLMINNNADNFIVTANNKQVGYINISEPTDALFGKTVSIYYAVSEEQRGKQYATVLIDKISDYLFRKREIDCIIAQVDVENKASQRVLIKNGFDKIYEDESDYKFVKLKKNAS